MHFRLIFFAYLYKPTPAQLTKKGDVQYVSLS